MKNHTSNVFVMPFSKYVPGGDEKFETIWKVILSGPSKKLSRSAIENVLVTDMCDEIMKIASEGLAHESCRIRKYSLYLASSFLYGTIIILNKQVTLLKFDVIAAYQECDDEESEVVVPKRRELRARSAVDEQDADVDIDEVQERRFVHLARPSEITMSESPVDPVVWQPSDEFDDGNEMLPIVFSRDHFINWSDPSSIESTAQLSQNGQATEGVAVTDPTMLNDDLPPFPPPEAFMNMDRESFLSWNCNKTLDEGLQNLPLDRCEHEHITLGEQLPVTEERSPKETMMDHGVLADQNAEETRLRENITDVEQKENIADDNQRQDIADDNQRQNISDDMQPSLELIPVHVDDGTNIRPARKRRPTVVDTDGQTISYESMKMMQLDYSSLLKMKEELLVDLTAHRYPAAEELLLPYPAYAGKRFPVVCRQLYRSTFSDKLTYQQAVTEDIFEPVYRGRDSALWHFQESIPEIHVEESGYKSLSGIASGVAYVEGTPARSRIDRSKGALSTSMEETAESLPTPGRITSIVTPEKNTMEGYVEPVANEEQPDFIPVNPLPVDEDVSLAEQGRFRESRSSKFEFARQWARGSSGFERRPSSIELMDPVPPADSAPHSLLSPSGRDDILSSSLKEELQSEEGRLLMSALIDTSNFVALSDIIPISGTSRIHAAKVFRTLLSFRGEVLIETKQNEPYGEIWIRAITDSNTLEGEAGTST